MGSFDLRTAKQMYDAMLDLYRSADQARIISSPISGQSLDDIFMAEFASYLMYLSASDGKIAENEVTVFRYITDLDMDASGMIAMIKECHIYSTAYESTVPIAMEIAVQIDKKVGHKGGTALPLLLFDFYGKIGALILSSDQSVTSSEKNDFNIYMNMLANYLKKQGY